MRTYLLASALIFVILLAWVGVQGVYRRFARRHPRLGPYREDACGGCTGSCGDAGHLSEARAPHAGMLNSREFTRP